MTSAADSTAPPGAELVTVIVVTWQGLELLPECLASLGSQTVAARTVVVDNASTDGTLAYLAAQTELARPPTVVALTENTGFAGGVAAGLQHVRTPYVALLNNDAAAEPEWLQRSLEVLTRRPDVAAVTAKMLLWNTSLINNAGVRLLAGGYGTDRGGGRPDGPDFAEAVEVFGFSGGAAVLRMAAVREVGGIEASYFLYYEDTELSWRLRLAGWSICYEPAAVVEHRHGASSDLQSTLFAFHTERNRLLTVLRCAPAPFALAQLGRFGLTTVSLIGRRLARQNVPKVQVFSARVRIRVIGSVLRRLPQTIAARHRISQLRPSGNRSSVPREKVLRRWLGG